MQVVVHHIGPKGLSGQETGVEHSDRLGHAAGHLGQAFRPVHIALESGAGLDALFEARQAGSQQGCVDQVGVCIGTGHPTLDAQGGSGADDPEARRPVVPAPGDTRGREGSGAVALVGIRVGRQKQGELPQVCEQPAEEPAKGVGRRGRDAIERQGAGEHRSALAVRETHVYVKRTARQVFIPLRHEGQRPAGSRSDLLGGQLVDDVPVRHLERRRIPQVDLVLARAPLALAELDGDAGRVHAPADLADHGLGEGAGENVVVLDVVLGAGEFAVPLVARRAIVLPEQEEFQFAPHERVEVLLGGTGELRLEQLPRRDGHGKAGRGIQAVAEDECRSLEPSRTSQRREIRNGVEIAVTRLPTREAVARRRVHLHVAREQVVAHVHSVGEHLVHEETPVDAFPDQSPVHVGERRHHRVDAPLTDFPLEVLPSQHSHRRGRHGAESSSTSRKRESWGVTASSSTATGYSSEKQPSQKPCFKLSAVPRKPSSER